MVSDGQTQPPRFCCSFGELSSKRNQPEFSKIPYLISSDGQFFKWDKIQCS